MEQAVWIAFGVIAVVLGFAIIANLISNNKDETRYIEFQESIDKLKHQCDFVCDSPLDTYLSVNVDLPSGMRLYTNENRICGHLNITDDYDDETKCVLCKCQVSGSLNLQTQLAKDSFDTHEYACFFERGENVIQMACKG